MSPLPVKSLAIIGCGASGTMVVANIVYKWQKQFPLHIIVYEQNSEPALGLAYSTPRAEHLLNVRASNMSAFAHDPAHFLNWLATQGHDFAPTDFVPRMIYGAYLQDILKHAQDNASGQNCVITIRHERVSSLARNSDGKGFIVTTDQGQNHYDAAVLTSGNARPVTLRGSEKLSSCDGFHAQPWNTDFETIVASGDDVLIAGTGLSMIDSVMSLHTLGHKGTITAISRHGLLPAGHTAPGTYPTFNDENAQPESPLVLLNLIRTHVRLAATQGISWHAVIDSLRFYTNMIWTSWSKEQQQKARRLLPFWNVHRHRMAPQIAQVITQWQDEGRLQIVHDRIDSITNTDEGLLVSGKYGYYHAAHVINALGYTPAQDICPAALISPDPAEQAQTGLYACGPVLASCLLETTAMPEIRAQSALIAKHILAQYQR